ncbi:MAG: aldose epimerase family protein [Planctomycetota bacterium]
MRIGFCLTAFAIGCLFSVMIRANNATGQSTAVDISQVVESIAEQEATVTPIEMEIIKREFAVTKDGQSIAHFICKNKNGYSFEVIEYGATITAVKTPDKEGLVENITLSCEGLEGYQACTSYFGSTVGRYCNRIAKGKFSIDGKEYSLATNNGPNHLHGGTKGFDKQIWKAERLMTESLVGVRLTLTSKNGDEGYPGTVLATVDYTLNNDNEFKVDITATTDAATHINLTNHNYWNLGGAGSGTILKHQLQLESDKYLPVDKTGIPTGEQAGVEGTPFDFRKTTAIGERLDQVGDDPKGYDHNYVLRSYPVKEGVALAATVFDPESGRKMEIHTDQPGIQFYTGNFLDGQPGSGGFNQHAAFCLETQFFPDSPNRPDFPSTLVKPGQTYRHTTVHKLSVVK